MRFTAHAPDGGAARSARKITFAGGPSTQGVSTIVEALIDGSVIYSDLGSKPRQLTGVDDVAELLAILIDRHHECSLIIHTDTGTSLRGNESHSADVYPPGVRPRLVVEG